MNPGQQVYDEEPEIEAMLAHQAANAPRMAEEEEPDIDAMLAMMSRHPAEQACPGRGFTTVALRQWDPPDVGEAPQSPRSLALVIELGVEALRRVPGPVDRRVAS